MDGIWGPPWPVLPILHVHSCWGRFLPGLPTLDEEAMGREHTCCQPKGPSSRDSSLGLELQYVADA